MIKKKVNKRKFMNMFKSAMASYNPILEFLFVESLQLKLLDLGPASSFVTDRVSL